MNYVTLDTETCGFHGPIVLAQYAEGDDGEIKLFCPWTNKIKESIELFEWLATRPILGFNLAFDWFHVAQMYTTLLLMKDKNAYLSNCIEEYAYNEPQGRFGPCIKPPTAHDVFLHARKTEYQSTMDRKDIVVKKIPVQLAYPLAQELEKRIPFKDIYFARRKEQGGRKWEVYERQDSLGDYEVEWRDIKVKFKPSSALKALAGDALNKKADSIIKFMDISPKFYPAEVGYAPYALVVVQAARSLSKSLKKMKRKLHTKWKGTWPDVIEQHIEHWGYNKIARQYAADDITYTRELYKYFGSPEFGDDDSVLACLVGCVRWKGYKIDIEKMKALKEKVSNRRYKMFHGERWKIPTAPKAAKKYILSALDEVERTVCDLLGSTKKSLLEELRDMMVTCLDCIEDQSKDCDKCKNSRLVPHKASGRAKEVLDARAVDKEVELYDKLILAGRFHASFKVIGALSSRMAGADGLNAQGIKSTKDVKGCFPLADEGAILAGGDFDAFEVTLADAAYNDEGLRKDLLTCEKCGIVSVFNAEKNDYFCPKCGGLKKKKIHALFGTFVYPNMTYEQIKATDQTDDDKYSRCKKAVFAMIYGGEAETLHDRLAVPLEVAQDAYEKFGRRYPGVKKARKRVFDSFCSMRQPNGIGSKVEWHEPATKVETLFGFPRYFHLENRVCKALFELASKVSPAWKDLKIKVQRRDRIQTVSGAIASALYAAAFNVQSKNMRAAANHEIQGSGAQITKRVQRAIWDLQPAGVSKWIVQPMNIHDSIMVPTDPEYVDAVKQKVHDTVETFRPRVPLIKMPWKSGLKDWSDKG